MAKRVVNPVFIIVVSIPIALVLNALLYMNRPVLVASKRLDLTGEHAYYRPSGDEVSGFKGSGAKYHRSPCPALNTLANHGYLPRDGKEITPRLLQQALVDVYNLDTSLAELLVSSLPAAFTLADMGVHNLLEHDASLVHDDSYSRGDPSRVNSTLASNLLSRGGSDQHLTKMTLAVYRREREADSAANTPSFEQEFTSERMVTSYSEPAVMLLVMGDDSAASISVDRANSFLVEERIPDDYGKPKTPVTLFWCLWLTLQLKMLAMLSPVLV
ncbi:hypothetical protein PRIC2_011097 [Phytophthora ramorum]